MRNHEGEPGFSRRFAQLVALLLLAGCGVDLTLPSGTSVTCVTDGDCPSGGVCATLVGRCVDDANGEPLRLESANAVSASAVVLQFNAAIEPKSALLASAYRIEPPLDVLDVYATTEPSSITLATGPQALGITYTVDAKGLVDAQGNALDVSAATASFVSFAGLAALAPPRLIAPAAGAVVSTEHVMLVWSDSRGASSYTVSLATRPDFDGATELDVSAPQTSLDVSVPDDVTYYWRVRADTTSAGLASESSFERLGGVVWVSCAAGETCALDTGVGNRSHPKTSINSAIGLAQSLGLPRVNIAARPDNATYEESVVVEHIAVDLYGGYPAGLTTLIRDPQAHATHVVGLENALRIVDIPGRIAIDGLTFATNHGLEASIVKVQAVGEAVFTDIDVTSLASKNSIAPPASAGITVENARLSGALVTFANVRVQLSGAADSSTGIKVAETSADLSDVVIHAGPAAKSYGFDDAGTSTDLSVRNCVIASNDATVFSIGATTSLLGTAAANIADTTITSGNASPGTSYGLQPIAPSATVERSRIFSGSGALRSGAVLVANRGLVIASSVIAAGPSPGAFAVSTAGLVSETGSGPTIVDSTLIVASRSSMTSVVSGNKEGTILINDILWVEGAGACYRGETITSAPATLIGNALHCGVLYTDPTLTLTTAAELADRDGRPVASTCSCTSNHQRVSGNRVITNDASDVFANLVGADGNVATLADADVSLIDGPTSIATTGVSGVATTCGYQEEARSCGGIGVDINNAPRTAPLSIGAFERD